jgi:hypothetical protein
MKSPKPTTLRTWARSQNVCVYGDITIHTEDLIADEHQRVVSRLTRGIPMLLEGLPYSDFGIDNISIKRVRPS